MYLLSYTSSGILYIKKYNFICQEQAHLPVAHYVQRVYNFSYTAGSRHRLPPKFEGDKI